ncbi:MAG: pseudouridine synthase, partial [Planctomycetia bacterium]
MKPTANAARKSRPAGPRRSRTTRVKPPAPKAPDDPGAERLQKILANAGFGSRRACEDYVASGRVTVNDKPVKELGSKANPDTQEVKFDGELIRTERKVYWWLNKPKNVLCTSRDPQGRPTVLDRIPDLGKRVYCVGRLDEDSTGLILVTNDGALAHRLTHPRYGVPKTYEALVAGKVAQQALDDLCQGVWLSDGKARAREAVRMGTQGNATWLKIVLCEGHNREIRRMLAKIGHKVMELKRTGIGPVKIRKLR